jgi:uncharacterized membrane protein
MRGPLAAALFVVAYALVSHWLMLHAANAPWAAALILGPLLLGLVGAALARRDIWSVMLVLAALALLALALSYGGRFEIRHLYVLQYVAINAMLCAVFAFSLRPGSTALITQLAAYVHRDFTPTLQAYTRGVTALWAGYFAVMAMACVAVFLLAPWTWWSAFANLLTPAAVVALFLGEQALRHLRHPEFERASMLQAWHAWQAHAAQSKGAGKAGARD